MKGLTIQEYADRKGVNIATVYRQKKAGKLLYYKDGNKIMITGERKDPVCKWETLFPGEPTEHIVSSCGHPLYFVPDYVETFVYCPWCKLKIEREMRFDVE